VISQSMKVFLTDVRFISRNLNRLSLPIWRRELNKKKNGERVSGRLDYSFSDSITANDK